MLQGSVLRLSISNSRELKKGSDIPKNCLLEDDPSLMVRTLLASKGAVRAMSDNARAACLQDWAHALSHFCYLRGSIPTPVGIFLDLHGMVNSDRAHTLLLQFQSPEKASSFLCHFNRDNGQRIGLRFHLLNGCLQLVDSDSASTDADQLIHTANFRVTSATLGRRRKIRMPNKMRPPSIPTTHAVKSAMRMADDVTVFQVKYTRPAKYACGKPPNWRPGQYVVVEKIRSFRFSGAPLSCTVDTLLHALRAELGLSDDDTTSLRVLPDSIDR